MQAQPRLMGTQISKWSWSSQGYILHLLFHIYLVEWHEINFLLVNVLNHSRIFSNSFHWPRQCPHSDKCKQHSPHSYTALILVLEFGLFIVFHVIVSGNSPKPEHSKELLSDLRLRYENKTLMLSKNTEPYIMKFQNLSYDLCSS